MANNNAEDISDVFVNIFLAEERYRASGYEDGLKDGRREGFRDALATGVIHGLAISREVGMYHGFANTYLMVAKKDTYNQRVVKTLESMRAIADGFDLSDPQRESLFDDLKCLRAKYKQVCVMLGISDGDIKHESLSY